MLKADLHVHTCYSMDCCTPLDKIVTRCLEVGINCIAVADHHSIAGALKLKEMAPFRVIVGEEVLTTEGELMGLFLTEEIPKGFSAEETIALIRKQGGLVNIPHPFGRSLWQKSNKLTSEKIISQLDIVEVFNSRSPFSKSNSKALRLAQGHSKAASAGSDAHTSSEIGRAYVEMPEFNGPDEFLNCLSQGKIYGRRSSALVHFASVWAKIKKRSGLYTNPLLPSEKDCTERKDSC